MSLISMLFPWSAFAKNPVLPGADPHAEVIEDKVWVYPTHSRGGANFFAFSSKDLVEWERHGPILDYQDVPWIKDDGRTGHGSWAPGVAVRDGYTFFYYSVGPQTDEHPARIGVAVADSPAGPFRDWGRPLLTGGRAEGFEAIDAMVFEDPESGRFLFYAGGSDGATLRVFELNRHMVSFKRELETRTPEKFTEGAFMHYDQGRYHLTYSFGNYRDHTYSVHYSTAKTPVGPWEYQGALLESDDRHKGPGHHSLIRHPETGDRFIVYHRWNNREGPGPYRGRRETAIDRIRTGPDGLLLPVKMTDEGVQPGDWPVIERNKFED